MESARIDVGNLRRWRRRLSRSSPLPIALLRLEDTEAKLAETEKEFEKSRREAKTARDEFNRIKKLR